MDVKCLHENFIQTYGANQVILIVDFQKKEYSYMKGACKWA